MPRTPRNEAEVNEVRDRILESALNIICDEGYGNLTMRKLGNALGCAAKTIYNYYGSKEEIYLRILVKAFEALNASADEALKDVSDPLRRLRILCNVYINFGLENVHYYDIMFSWDVPKYTNYLGTYFESAASEEKATAMHYAVMAEAVISEILSKKGGAPKDEIAYHVIRMWSMLHGYVSLHNSHSFREYHSDALQFRQKIVEEILANF